MNDTLVRSIRRLRLSGLLDSLEIRLQEAAGNNLAHEEFLELILQDELNVREQRLIARRVKAARFRDLKSLEDFDFSFNPSVKRKQVFDLASCRFIREQRDVLFVGPPGVGKSHLAQALGYHAIRVGDNPGEHTIVFAMLGEMVELTVRATNRDCYALGALASPNSSARRTNWHSKA